MIWLVRLLLVAALAWLGWRYVRRYLPRRRAASGAVPDHWHALSERDDRFREAVEVRSRLQDLAADAQSLVDASILDEVDRAVESLAGLASIVVRLREHMSALDPHADRTLGPDRASAQRDRVAALALRAGALEAELGRAVSDLRHAYLHVLEGVSGTAPAIHTALDKTRRLRATVATRVEAEREVEALLHEGQS